MSEVEKKGERISKFIANAGFCSRREAERLIEEGKVLVNGVKIKTPVFFVEDKDEVRVGKTVIKATGVVKLWAFYKPRGYLCTKQDPQGRKTIYDILPKALQNALYIGRLDFNSEGLLLLTNNSDLKRKLELPTNQFVRRYKVRIFGKLDKRRIARLEAGIEVEGFQYKPCKVFSKEKDLNQTTRNFWIEIEIMEGKNREVRKLFEAVDCQVNRLIRIAFHTVNLQKLEIEHGDVVSLDPSVLKF